MRARSFSCPSISVFKETLEACFADGFSPNLAIVMTSTGHDITSLGKICRQHQIDLVGCTTAGEIVDAQLLEGSIALLLLEVDPSHYQISYFEHHEREVYEGALKMGQTIKDQFANPALLIFSAGLRVDAELLIKGIQEGIGKPVPMYGGLAGDDLQMLQTTAFTQDDVTQNGVVGLVFNGDKIKVSGKAISGWEPVGGVNTITKAVGNVVYSINDERAYDVFVRYFGFSDQALSKSDQLITLQTNYPFQFLRANDEVVLRSPMVVDKEEGTIVLTSSVRAGDQFRFSYSPGFEIIAQTVHEFEQLHQDHPKADALILFSCKGRHGAFGPLLKKEIEGIFHHWQRPLIGFLSYGEIGNMATNVCEFHNETCSLALLKAL